MSAENTVAGNSGVMDEGSYKKSWVSLKEVMYGTGLPIDVVTERIGESDIITRDTGRKFLYLTDKSFSETFPEFDRNAAKKGNFEEFKGRVQQYMPGEDGDGTDELDFSGNQEMGYGSDRWNYDAEQQIVDALKRSAPSNLLTRDEEVALGKGMKADMEVIVRMMFDDLRDVVSKYFSAISPEGEGAYFRTFLPENEDYGKDGDEMPGYPQKGSARDIFDHYKNEAKKELGEKGLEGLLKGSSGTVKALARSEPDPEYVRYVYNHLTKARQEIKNMGTRKRSEAAKKLGFREYSMKGGKVSAYKDMEEKMSSLDDFMESYTKRRNIFVEHNIRLVLSLASNFRNRGLEYMDLVQEGLIGVERAAVNYDYKLGYKFSTYESWWIKQRMYRAIQDQSKTIRVPVHLWPVMYKTMDIIREFNSEHDRNPTTEELVNEFNKRKKENEPDMRPKNMESLLMLMKNEARLDAPVRIDGEEEEELSLGHTIADNHVPSAEENVIRKEREVEMQAVLRQLLPREEKIIAQRYGMNHDEDERTLEEVSHEFDVTRERIRQVQASTERKIPGVLKTHFGFRTIKELREAYESGELI